MSGEGLRYDRMVEDALRSVVRRALVHVAERGLPGSHHFYITFRTDHSDSDIPQALRDRYPGEMTIVLQHQFWGLEVDEDKFCVTLSFADVPHRLVVPFAAVTAFADPSVRFGLQFDVESGEPGAEAAEDDAPRPAPTPLEVASREPGSRESGQREVGPREAGPREAGPVKDEQKPGEKVVTLDAFRKK